MFVQTRRPLPHFAVTDFIMISAFNQTKDTGLTPMFIWKLIL